MIFITWLLGGAVPTKQAIKTYEYKSPPLSLCERLFLDKFWSALPGTVSPPWLAPNVITLAGLACIVLAVALVLHHSPALEGAAHVGCVEVALGIGVQCVELQLKLFAVLGRHERLEYAQADAAQAGKVAQVTQRQVDQLVLCDRRGHPRV